MKTFERFQYYDFEINFLKNKIFFKILRTVLVKSTKTENTSLENERLILSVTGKTKFKLVIGDLIRALVI